MSKPTHPVHRDDSLGITLRRAQGQVFGSKHRFRVLVAGRRFGKTHLALVELCRAAWGPGRCAWYVTPTYVQAKRIAWARLKQLTRPYWAKPPIETDLRIELQAGGSIALRGADRYDSLRGIGLDFLVLDEYADIAPQAWTEALRPMLSDRLGQALFIGTPRGFNHFYELYSSAHHKPGWAAWQFVTAQGGNVAQTEIEAARHELDEKTYRQEYEASFENLYAGRAYYGFDRQRHVRPLKFNRRVDLCWSLDFNIHPMCSVLAQRLDSGEVHVLEEIVLPESNTWEACEAFLTRTRDVCADSRLRVRVYGDASGNQRCSAAARTDWQIVKEFFARHADRYELIYRVASANPPVKDRINCVNARIRNQAGEDRLFVDPQCKTLVADLEQVVWRRDAHGNTLTELDKSNPKLTHVSDALGYLVVREFPMRSEVGEY